MLTDIKPNHQADSLYTEKAVSEDSHLQIEPDTNRQLLNKNASEDSDTLNFDYLTDFGGDKALIEEAKAVSKSFVSFLRRTFKDLTRLGTELWGICNKCVDSLGKTEGKAQFNRWLKEEFGKSQNLARAAMSLSQWYNTLSPAMQRLVAKNVKNWSVAAIKKLTSLTDELVAVLVKSGKQTAQSIERAIATSLADELAPLPAEEGDRPVTSSDWSSLRERFNLRPRHIKVLKQKAESLASLEELATSTPPVVKVSHVNEAIAQCKEDPEILSQPAKKAKKNKIAPSTPADRSESALQDNSVAELVSSAIAGDMEKELAANSRTSAKLQQALAEKNNTQAAQEEQINSAIAGEHRDRANAHSRQMDSLRQALGAESPPVEEKYTQKQLDEALAREREKRKDYVYTEEDVLEEVAYACDELKSKMYTNEQVENEIEYALSEQFATLTEKMYTEEQMQGLLAEARAEVLSSADTPDAEKLASYERTLAQKDREIVSLSEQKTTALAKAHDAAEQLKANRAVEQARSNRMEKMARELAYKLELLENQLAEKDRELASLEKQNAAADPEEIASLQRALTEKDQAIASMSEQTAAAVDQARAEERKKTASEMASQITSLQQTLASLQRALAEKDQEIASLEKQNGNSVASGSPLMEKEREAALSQARAEEREKMAIVMASKLESLQKELAEKNQAIASSSEEKAAAVAEARADEQAVAWHDIEVLQKEIESLRAANHSLRTTREQLATANK